MIYASFAHRTIKHSFHVWSSAIFGDGTGCGSGAVAAIGGLGSVAFDPKAAGAPWCVRDIQRHTEIPSGYLTT